MKAVALTWTALALLSSALAQADMLADPTRPATLAGRETYVAPGVLQVTAILFSGARRVAIINGKAVSEGDRIGDARIDSIDAGAVNYSRAGRHESARLPTQALVVRQRATQ